MIKRLMRGLTHMRLVSWRKALVSIRLMSPSDTLSSRRVGKKSAYEH
jgi:hypothetical protein